MKSCLLSIWFLFIIIFLDVVHCKGQIAPINYADSAQLFQWIKKSQIHQGLSEYDSAVSYLQKATFLIIKSNHIDSSFLSRLYYKVSKLYSLNGSIGGATEFMQKTLDYKPHKSKMDSTEMAFFYNEFAYLFFISDNYEHALKYYKNALNIYVSNKDQYAIEIGQVYSNIAAIYYYIDNFELALKNNFNSLNVIVSLLGERHPYVGMNFSSIALIYTRINEFALAEIYYKKAENILSNSIGEFHPEIAKLYRNLGLNYYYQKNYEQAIFLIKKALQIVIKNFGELNIQVADIYNELALVYAAQEDYEIAIDFYQKALRIYQDYYGKSYKRITDNLNNIAEMFYRQGKLKRSLDYYKKSLEIYNKFLREPHLEYTLNYTNIGTIYSRKGDYSRALFYFQKALMANSYTFTDTSIFSNPELKSVISRPDLLVTLREKAFTLYLRYLNKGASQADLNGAFNTYQLTISLLGMLRNEQQNQNEKLLLNAENKNIFATTIDIAYKLYINDPEKLSEYIFEFVEKSKSDVLFTSINELNAKKLAGIPDSLLTIEKNIRTRLTFYNTQIQKETESRTGYDTIKVMKYEQYYSSIHNDYDKFVASLEKNYPKYYELKYKTKVANYWEIQQSLTKNSALLEYFLGDSALFILVLTKDDIHMVRLNVDTGFLFLIIDFYRSIKKVDTRDFIYYSHSLYNYLVKPISKYIEDKENLIIIPDEYLLYVPFETLISNKSDTFQSVPDFTLPDYLIRKFNITYHYTASLWMNSLDSNGLKKHNGKGFGGYAPVFNEPIPDTISQTPVPRKLPFSEQEVKNIIALFNNKNIKSDGYFNKEANEGVFKKSIRQYKFIHIATHSIINDRLPALSYIDFYPVKDTVYQNDGVLYTAETYNLNIDADLVVLSACETGIGKLIKGEGLLAFSRGFLYSGSNNILFSLWNVYDRSTKDLMEEFYTQVLENKSYSESLRLAKLKLISNKSTAFPVNWGGFILVGQ